MIYDRHKNGVMGDAYFISEITREGFVKHIDVYTGPKKLSIRGRNDQIIYYDNTDYTRIPLPYFVLWNKYANFISHPLIARYHSRKREIQRDFYLRHIIDDNCYLNTQNME